MRQKSIVYLLFISLALFVVGWMSEAFVLKQGTQSFDIERFSRNLHKKQAQVDDIINNIAEIIHEVHPDTLSDIFPLLSEYNELFEDNEYAIVVTRKRGFHFPQAVFWSDHVVGFSRELSDKYDGLIQLPNGWFMHQTKRLRGFTIHGLILVKTNFSYNNNYLKNRFASDFKIPDEFLIEPDESSKGKPIFDKNGGYLFSVLPSGNLPCAYEDLYYPVFFFLLALTLFLYSMFHLIVGWKVNIVIKWLSAFVVVAGLYAIFNWAGIPHSINYLRLFNSDYFAYNSFWSSLGDFLFFSGFIFFLASVFFKTFTAHVKWYRRNKIYNYFSAFVFLGINMLFFISIFHFVEVLVANSTISYAIYRVDDISVPSFIGFFSIALLYLSYALTTIKISATFRSFMKHKSFFVVLLISAFVNGLIMEFVLEQPVVELNLYFIIISYLSFIINEKHFKQRKIYVIVLSVLVFTLLSLRYLTAYIENRDREIQQLHAVNMAEERDPIAEMHLKEVDTRLKQDTLIESMLIPPYDIAESFIKKHYFEGYLRDYDLQVTFCHKDDSLLLQPDNELVSCLPFFDQMIHENGTRIPGTRFFFVDNMNGRITYLAEYKYTQDTDHDGHRLFLELNSRILSEGTGFPELLYDKTTFRSLNNQSFSYAKYDQGRLIDRGGAYQYSMVLDAYQFENKEIQFINWDHYVHCIYAPDSNSVIILSRPELSIFDYLVSFPYVFVFLFIIAIIAILLLQGNFNIGFKRDTLGNRIQVSIIAIVFFSVLFIGGGMVIYNVNQYQRKYKNDLVEKIRSISVELDLSIGDLKYLDRDMSEFLTYELIRISEIFRTDINLFGLNGHLITTSRPEIYNKGLISRMMDNTAYNNLRFKRPTRLVHREHIGAMHYFSAYEPLINSNGNAIGYLNVPYFTKENEFRHEIATFIFAFINIYVFILMASILVAVFVSNRITDPLNMIRERLKSIQLGKRSGLIEYHGSDEIGLLVKEYNSKVDELAESVELLAKSERESAWREMAKQIAHEIKNPLTPMKLNIQFLQKTSIEGKEEFQKHVNRISSTLIEQIDNLSTIATEFSNFANMPKAHNEVVEVKDKLHNIVRLFENNRNCKFFVEANSQQPIEVFVDKEQLSRGLINLVKNAIQAVPPEREARVKLKADLKFDTVIIEVEDNGIGISDDLRETIFVPNFTTKSSGTGLGLAITKNIVDNFGGKIWFESSPGNGTSFFIELPLWKMNVE